MRIAPIARWLLPWVAVLVVSSAIAHAAGDALERNMPQPRPDPVESVTQEPCRVACLHWVEISSIDPEGQPVSVSCLVADNRFSADALQVHFDDLNAVVVDLCQPVAVAA